MLYWRRLAHSSGFELKCRPNLESTRSNPGVDSPRSGDDSAFWRRLVLRIPEIYFSAFLSRVDSDPLGVGSALRAPKTDPLSVDLSCLGVD